MPHDFTIIDDVPKPILADALELTRQRIMREAQDALRAEIARVAQEAQAPGGNYNLYPSPDQVRAMVERTRDAGEAYIEQLDLATRVQMNVRQLREESAS